jgi:hypothetical protein
LVTRITTDRIHFSRSFFKINFSCSYICQSLEQWARESLDMSFHILYKNHQLDVVRSILLIEIPIYSYESATYCTWSPYVFCLLCAISHKNQSLLKKQKRNHVSSIKWVRLRFNLSLVVQSVEVYVIKCSN